MFQKYIEALIIIYNNITQSCCPEAVQGKPSANGLHTVYKKNVSYKIMIIIHALCYL